MPQQPKIRICPICGSEYTGKRKKTCGKPECVKALRNKSAENMKTCVCILCGKEFKAPRITAKYCTRMHPKTCVVCGKEFIVDTTKGHATDTITCSPHCGAIYSHLNGKDKAVRQSNSQAKYGVDNPLQADEVKAKIKASQDANPDSDYRFGSDNFTNLIKDKYGVDNVSKLDSVKHKKSDTVMQHYGVDNPMKSPAIQQHIKDTNLDKYGVPTVLTLPENIEKARESCRQKWGADTPWQSKKFMALQKERIRNEFGVDYYTQTDECKNKTANSNIAKYGVKTTLELPEVEQARAKASIDKYGTANPFDSDACQHAIKQTMMDKYGAANPSQVPEFQDKKAATINRHANDPSYHKNYKRISKLNIKLAQKLHDDIGCETEFEAPIGNGMSADLKCTLDGRSVLVDLNPTVSHNIDVPFACLINGCDSIPNCSKHVNPITPSYHYDRTMTALHSDSNTPYLQFYGWDSYEHIRRAVIFMLNSDSDENCKHCKHVLNDDDTVIISNPNPAVVNRFIKDYAYNTNPVVNQVSGVNAIIDADDNTIADNATSSANNASTIAADNVSNASNITSDTTASTVSMIASSDYNSNAIITAASTVSSNASSSVNSAAANNVNNNVNSSADNNVRVYAVARKSDACIIMLLVLVDGCVSVIPRFDVSGVNHADIVNIVKNFIVKYELSNDGNMMVRLFLDSDSVFMRILLDAGFKPVGEHEPVSAFVNMVSDNVLMTAGDSVNNNAANNIAVSDGCVRVVSSGSQLFAL